MKIAVPGRQGFCFQVNKIVNECPSISGVHHFQRFLQPQVLSKNLNYAEIGDCALVSA